MPPPGYVTCQPLNTTTAEIPDIGEDDLNALLYIVVTLLFYSMGIVIGIITYLKREQAEMEEDKMFDLYLHMKREPFNIHKQERVNQMALYLKQMEDRQAAREKIRSWDTRTGSFTGSGNEQLLPYHNLCAHHQQQCQQHQHQQQQQQHSHHYQHQHHHHQQQQQQHGHQYTDSSTQHHLDPHKQPSPGPCSLCEADGATFSDIHAHTAHLDPNHLQPFTPRSRHSSSGRETPAGTPALLCSLTLNVCEPFLSPETLPKAALPFRNPTARGAGLSPNSRVGGLIPTSRAEGLIPVSNFNNEPGLASPRPSAFAGSSAEMQAQDYDNPLTDNSCKDNGRAGREKEQCFTQPSQRRTDNPNAHNDELALQKNITIEDGAGIELQELRGNQSHGLPSQSVFQADNTVASPLPENPGANNNNKIKVYETSGSNNNCDTSSSSCSSGNPNNESSFVDEEKDKTEAVPSQPGHSAAPSTHPWSRSLSTDVTPVSSSGRHRLRRQLSLHPESRSPVKRVHRHSAHPPVTEEEKDTDPGLPEKDLNACSVGTVDSVPVLNAGGPQTYNDDENSHCDSPQNPGNNEDSALPSVVGSSNNAPTRPVPETNAKIFKPLTVSNSEPSVPEDTPLSPSQLANLPNLTTAVTPPQDARPKIYSILGGSEGAGIARSPSSTVGAQMVHGPHSKRDRLREAWRKGNPQSVDVAEFTRLQQGKPASNSNSPALARIKGQQQQQPSHSQQEVAARSTFPRSRDSERRGALFLSQKSLLHVSGAGSRPGGGAKGPPQTRLTSAQRGVLGRQVSLDSSSPPARLLSPHDSDNVDTPLLSQQGVKGPLGEEDTVSMALNPGQRHRQGRIPKLSRAKTMDPSI